MIVALEDMTRVLWSKQQYVNLLLMKEIFFQHIPQVGDTITLETWEFPRGKEMTKTPVATTTITAVDSVVEQEWNPVLKARESVTVHYVTLSLDGKLYKRRVILGGITPASPRGFYQESLAASSPDTLPDS